MAEILAVQGRVLFLSEDPALIEAQLAGRDLSRAEAGELRSDVSTDEITPPSTRWPMRHDVAARGAVGSVNREAGQRYVTMQLPPAVKENRISPSLRVLNTFRKPRSLRNPATPLHFEL